MILVFILSSVLGEKLYWKKDVGNPQVASVIYDESSKKYSIKPTYDTSAIAFATYSDTLESIGWGVLEITGSDQNGTYSADQVYYAHGLLEGHLTAERIAQNAENMNQYWNLGPKQESIEDFFGTQMDWASGQGGVSENLIFIRVHFSHNFEVVIVLGFGNPDLKLLITQTMSTGKRLATL